MELIRALVTIIHLLFQYFLSLEIYFIFKLIKLVYISTFLMAVTAVFEYLNLALSLGTWYNATELDN